MQVEYVLSASWICLMITFHSASRVLPGCNRICFKSKLDMLNGYFSRCKSSVPRVQFVHTLGTSRICIECKLNMTNGYFLWCKSDVARDKS